MALMNIPASMDYWKDKQQTFMQLQPVTCLIMARGNIYLTDNSIKSTCCTFKCNDVRKRFDER